MAKNDVRALRAFPETNRYFLCAATMKEQLDIISECKIPLFLEPRHGFEGIYSVLRDFPKLTVILCNIGCWPSARYVYPLLKNYENFYFETGDFGMLRGYEQICERFGSKRMLFGTNFPTNNMACSMNMLMNAKISDEAKDDIAFRNMERLLEGVRL